MCSITVAACADGVKPRRVLAVVRQVTMKTLVVATVVLGLASCGHHTRLAKYREPQDGWTVSYPASMSAHAIGYAKGMLCARGAVIASSADVRPTEEVNFRRFPPDAVAFGLVRYFGGPAREMGGPETRLPLERARFTSVRGAPPPATLEQLINANGSTWHVFVWFGPKASDKDKDAVWRIVRTIRMPPAG
jgi:hypothetical protein